MKQFWCLSAVHDHKPVLDALSSDGSLHLRMTVAVHPGDYFRVRLMILMVAALSAESPSKRDQRGRVGRGEKGLNHNRASTTRNNIFMCASRAYMVKTVTLGHTGLLIAHKQYRDSQTGLPKFLPALADLADVFPVPARSGHTKQDSHLVGKQMAFRSIICVAALSF